MRFPRLPRWSVVLTAVVTGSVLVHGPAQAAPGGHVRLDQVGYGTFESKQAYLLLPHARPARYEVVDANGRTVWARAATHWAKVYLTSGDTDTLNVYNTSALGHYDLAKLLRAGIPGAEVTEREVVADLRRQLQSGVASAASSPFRTAASVERFDVATRSFGFAATARLYRDLTGDRRFDAFGVRQRDFTLGANAWGTSLVIGVGGTFPNCPHHQAANLSGDPNGGHDVLVGGVTNGPNARDLFDGLGEVPEGAIACAKPYTLEFDSPTSRFVDELTSWPSSEPAIDFTATAVVAFTLT